MLTKPEVGPQCQTKILAQEASGEELDIGFIFIHGQDHLMTTLLLRDLIQDFIALYKERSKGGKEDEHVDQTDRKGETAVR